jgi:protein transport protein SEC61 subunit gamma-like protein
LRMKEETKVAENKLKQIKDRLDLDELGDMELAVPSMNLQEYIRVLKLARKPSREEFTMIAKVSIAGMALIGVIGFLIFALLTELPKSF